jgi:hypothetical protein
MDSRPVAVRLAGDVARKTAVAGKPDCYGSGLQPTQASHQNF